MSPPQSGPPIPESDERNWAVLTHLAGFLVFSPVPFGHILGPLVVWLFKRSESKFLDRHGKAALNFQISFTIYFAVLGVFLLGSVFLSLFLVGIPLLIAGVLMFSACLVLWIVSMITAATRASSGRDPGYMFVIPIIG